MSFLIDNSFNTNTAGQPIRPQADFDWLQLNTTEKASAIIESMIGNYDGTKTYVLQGCVASSSGGTTTVTPGYVYGKPIALGSMISRAHVYFVPSASFADPVGPAVVVGNIIAVPSATWDPTPFTDGSNNNIHNEYKLQFSAGASGSGFVNYGALVFTYFTHNYPITPASLNGMTVTFERHQSFTPGATASVNTIHLSNSNYKQGAEVTIYISCTAGQTIVFAGSVSVRLVTGSSSLTLANSTNVYIRLKYITNSFGTGVVDAEIYNPA